MQKHERKLWIWVSIFCLAMSAHLWVNVEKPVMAQDGDTPLVSLNEDNIKQATVFIMQTRDTANGPVISCVGTGTLVRADGLILTNAHLVEETAICPSDRLVIALTLRVDEPPVPIYVAEIAEFSRGLDLAVLRIVSFLDGRRIEPGSLSLPFVELGDSNLIQANDTVVIFGYPDIGNDVVSSIRATVTGFTAETNFGERAWIRTNAEIPGVMSGGGMYNRDGVLIGIPTIAPARIAGVVVDCRQVYDTDGNRQINENDVCIPIGGAISAIRPSRLARGLVRAAVLGIELGPERAPVQLPPPTEEPRFSRLIVSTGVNQAGQPINIITGAPTNTNSLYLFFDYDNMENGLVYELRTTIDGRPSATDSLPPVTWSGGRSGMWYIGGTRIPRPNGTYQFTLFIEGRQVATSDPITIGGGPRDIPQFSDIIFGIESSLQQLAGPSFVIPETNIIRARFTFRNMRPGLFWQQRWYINGVPLQGGQASALWEISEAQGQSDAASIQSEQGFPSGRYRLELYIAESEGEPPTLSATADFVVAGGAGGRNSAQALIFDNFRFAQNQRGGIPLGQAENLPSQSEAVYIFFNWRQISPGTPWTWRWYVDDDLLIEERTHWNAENNGENYFISLVGNPVLPDATYRFEIEIGGLLITEDEVETRVGIGQLPVDTFANAEGIQLVGRISDAETGKGLNGALFIVLLADFSVEDFLWDEKQILGQALADENGFFQIPQLIPRGTLDEPLLYSVLVRAEGYLPISADGIAVTDATQSPLELTIEMNQD